MACLWATVLPLTAASVRYTDLRPGLYDTRINHSRKARGHVRQLQALGYKPSATRSPSNLRLSSTTTHPGSRLEFGLEGSVVSLLLPR